MYTKELNFKSGDIVRIIGIFGLDITGIYKKDVFDTMHLFCAQHADMHNPTFITDDKHYCTFSHGALNLVELATENEIKDFYNHLIERFKFEHQDWAKYFTDSTYDEFVDWFTYKCGIMFDDDEGYPDFIYEFTNYAWDALCKETDNYQACTDYVEPEMVNKQEFIEKTISYFTPILKTYCSEECVKELIDGFVNSMEE